MAQTFREKVAAKIASNSPSDAYYTSEARAKMFVLNLTRRIAGDKVDRSQFKEGSWDTATSCVYLGAPRGMVIEGVTYPLVPGKVYDEPTMFAMLRDGDLRADAMPLADVHRNGKPQRAKQQTSLVSEAQDGAVAGAKD